MKKTMTYSLGIIGGMGPKASAYFLDRLYKKLSCVTDNESPDIILLSLSSFPDRTEAVLNKCPKDILDKLNQCILYLNSYPVTEIFVPCFTMHGIIRLYNNIYDKKIVMLDTLLFDFLKKYKNKSLLLCTNGALKTNLFEDKLKEYIVIPDAADVDNIHQMIYSIKSSGVHESMLDFISNLSKKYKVSSVIYGCTELHMLQSLNKSSLSWSAIDILEEISDFIFKKISEKDYTDGFSIRDFIYNPQQDGLLACA